MLKICHVTDAHPPEDGRIFRRASVSSARAGYDTYLVECGNSYDKSGVHIVGIGKPNKPGRLNRIFLFSKKAYKEALKVDADLYHLHDPELLLYALKFKRNGKHVVFDSHENYVEQIKCKPYLNPVVARFLSFCFQFYLKFFLRRIDGITYPGSDDCSNIYKGLCSRVVSTDNLPWLSELYDLYDENVNKQAYTACYIGGLDNA